MRVMIFSAATPVIGALRVETMSPWPARLLVLLPSHRTGAVLDRHLPDEALRWCLQA